MARSHCPVPGARAPDAAVRPKGRRVLSTLRPQQGEPPASPTPGVVQGVSLNPRKCQSPICSSV